MIIVMRRRKEREPDIYKAPSRPRSSRISSSRSQILKRLTSSGVIVKPVNIKDANQTRHICRVCLKNGDIPIYGDRHFANICEDLMTFGGIKVRPEDAYPKYLCQSCRGLLEGAVTFRKTAQQSDKVLRQPIKKEIETFPVEDLNDDTNFDPQTENESETSDWDDKSVVYKHMKFIREFNAEDQDSVVGKRIMNFEYDITVEKETVDWNTSDTEVVENSAPKMTNRKNVKTKNDSDSKKSTHKTLKSMKDNGHLFVGTRILTSNYQIVERDDDYTTDSHNNCIEKRKAEGGPNISKKRKKPKSYKCRRCKSVYDTKQTYTDHLRSDEHRNTKVPCPVCRELCTAVCIRQHITEKHPEATLMCDICGKECETKSILYSHRKRHIAVEKQFKCELCNYRCKFKDYLNVHMRTHFDRPYRCPHCPDRSFINTGNLNRHMLTNHKAERDFNCNECGKGFHTKRELDVHVDAIHRGVTHPCSFCGKPYSFLRMLRKHERVVHKKQKWYTSKVKQVKLQYEDVDITN